MLVWNKSEENVLTIDLNTYGIYGKEDNFTLYYKYKDDSTLVKYNVNFTEILENVSNSISIVANNTSTHKQIKVNDVSNVKIGMRFKVRDKNIYFYVDDINTTNNIIYTRYVINDSIKNGDILDQVGNTGTYQAKLTFNRVGKVLLLVRNVKDKIDFNVTHLEVTDFFTGMKSRIQTLYNINMCKMEVKDNKLKYFDTNNNEIASFNLYDSMGNATETDVYKREPE